MGQNVESFRVVCGLSDLQPQNNLQPINPKRRPSWGIEKPDGNANHVTYSTGGPPNNCGAQRRKSADKSVNKVAVKEPSFPATVRARETCLPTESLTQSSEGKTPDP